MEKKRQTTVLSLFSNMNKKRCLEPKDQTPTTDCKNSESDADHQQTSATKKPDGRQTFQLTDPEPGISCGNQNSKVIPSSIFNRYDIGTFSEQKCHREDHEKYGYITATWVPAVNYKFPCGDRNLKFQHQWLTEFKWLAYSEAKEGAFCKFCVIFAASFDSGKGAHVHLSSLVNKPFIKWKNAKQEFREHEKKGYHQKACIASQNFISVFKNKAEEIHIQVNTQLKKTISENREKLTPIVNTILFCGRQGLPLRGHVDYGQLLDEDGEILNDGKFRALLRFRIEAGDVALRKHLETAGGNAIYLSKRIQNEIIDIAGGLVSETIVNKINKSVYFSILADETADISGTEQFALCARYVYKDEDHFTIYEDFLRFVPVFDLRGFALADVLKQNIVDLGLSLSNVRGLGFDGAANMSGVFNGCAAKFQECYPQAIYIHCASHSLNLALSHACTVSPMKNCLANIHKIITFFRASPKRENVLKNKVLIVDAKARRTRLMKFCETRWIERLDAVSLFVELFPFIIESMTEIQDFSDTEASSQAFSFLAAMQKPAFLVSMTVSSNVFSLSHGLASVLQSKQVDLKTCVDLCENLEKELQDFRLHFHRVYKQAESIAQVIGITLEIPRTTGRQTQRSNFNTESPEEYYKLSIFLPFIDYFMSQLKDRFLNHKGILQTIQTLLPKNIVQASDEHLQKAVDAIVNQWPDDIDASPESFFNELKMWRRSFLEQNDHHELPKDFITSLNSCNEVIFPFIHRALKVFCTLPVTTATPERSFSSLRYLKTYLRSTMGADRLNGLALMYIHNNVEIKTEEVLDKMGKKSRRLRL